MRRNQVAWAKLAGVKRTMQLHEALLGLIDVKSGAVENGLAAVEDALAFAKRVDHIDVRRLSRNVRRCLRGRGSIGQSVDVSAGARCLEKKIDRCRVMPPYAGLTESLQFQTGSSAFDDNLLVRAQRLQAGVQQRIQHFVETAINAEIASGHDLYRTFRVAKLSRCLATAHRLGRGTDCSARVGRAAMQHWDDGYPCPHTAKEARIVRQ